MKETLELLTRARDLISDPARWTQGMVGRDAQGLFAEPDSDKATRWCATGALFKFTGCHSQEYNRSIALLCEASKSLSSTDGWSITNFNDLRPHEDVMRMYDLAIERAEILLETPD